MNKEQLRKLLLQQLSKSGFATSVSKVYAAYLSEMMFHQCEYTPTPVIREELFLLSNVLKFASDETIS